jgi:hypothetical protein
VSSSRGKKQAFWEEAPKNKRALSEKKQSTKFKGNTLFSTVCSSPVFLPDTHNVLDGCEKTATGKHFPYVRQ